MNPNTGEYWEVKTGIPLVDKIREQLDRYLNPIEIFQIEEKELVSELVYGTSIKNGNFEFTGKLGTKIKVAYEQTNPGIVRYKYTISFEKSKEVVVNAAAVVTVGSLGQAVGKSITSHQYQLGPGLNSRLFGINCRLN